MKPFHIRGWSWTIIAGLVAAAALTPGDAPAPRGASGGFMPAYSPASAATGANRHDAVSAAGVDRPARRTAPKADRAPALAPKLHEPGARPAGAAFPAQPGAGGRIVALDPETGQLGQPSAEQVRALRPGAGISSVSRSDEGLVETRLTDGTVILDLDGRFQDHAVARLDRNGKLTYGCVRDDGKKLVAPVDTASTTALEEK